MSGSQRTTFTIAPFDGEYQICKCYHAFLRQLSLFLNISIENCWLWKFRWKSCSTTLVLAHHSLANIRIYKCDIMYFCVGSHRFWDINISNFFLENIGQGHEVGHLQLRHITHFRTSCHCFRYIYVSNMWPWKCSTFAVTPIDKEYQHL